MHNVTLTKTPLISILMPVYNGEKYIRESVDSILSQTFTDFEFLIVEDGSTDGTVEILAEYARKDSRIRIIYNEKNSGVAESLNRGLKLACGEYIARMDADDVSLPERLAVQVAYLLEHPNVSVCGTFLSIYGTEQIWDAPVENEAIRAQLLFYSCLYHPTIIMKKETVVSFGTEYDLNAVHAEDYHLWARLSLQKKVIFANIPLQLLKYRIYSEKGRERYKGVQRNTSDEVRKMLLSKIGITPSTEEYSFHELCFTPGSAKSSKSLMRCNRWLLKIYAQNKQMGVYDDDALKNVLFEEWHKLCKRSANKVIITSLLFFCSALTPRTVENLKRSIMFLSRFRG